MAFYLYLNTGSINHGCEAIVRSTCKILNENNKAQIILASSNVEQDKRFHLDTLTEIVSAATWKNIPQHVFYYIMRRLTGNSKLGMRELYKDFLKRIKKEDIAFCIGGDTYCYTYPEYLEVCLDYIKKTGARSVLWATSIEPSAMSERMISHLNNYDYLVVREEVTCQALLGKGIPKSKILKTCDPAFHLPVVETKLPQKFDEKNTVGLNVSSLVAGEENSRTQNAFNTIRLWLQDLLVSTDYSVCLIPHVYGKGTDGKDDLYYATMLYSEVPDTMKSRVSIVDEELSCVQLKYIISKCRFFVGARTHSMIAAYSSGVPAIALGYSVKADGIAVDLFGTTENYVLNIDKLQQPGSLKKAFTYLTANEDAIREQYTKKLPMYKESIVQAAKIILKDKENTVLNEI